MRALALTLISALLSGCSAQDVEPKSRPDRPTSKPTGFDHSGFDRILRSNVRDEKVDYLSIRKRHWVGLSKYLEELGTADLGKLPDKQRLTALINLYNAVMIQAVLERFHDGYSPSANKFEIFDAKIVAMRTGKVSLNHLENEIIRKQFKEPGIHVALVCGAVSCPPLLPRAYVAKDLDETLAVNMRRFINDPKRNTVDPKARRLELSQIFNWYAIDFGGKDALRSFLKPYLANDVSGYEVKFRQYSWKLNIARPAAGRWVKTVAGATLAAKRGGRGETKVAKDRVFEVLSESEGWLELDDPVVGMRRWIKKTGTVPY